MAMKQVRWFCSTCKREWHELNESTMGVRPRWKPEHGCPGCHGSQIQPVTFTPPFPGGDIPRGENDMPTLVVDSFGVTIAETSTAPPPEPRPAQAPPLALVASVPRDDWDRVIDDLWGSK